MKQRLSVEFSKFVFNSLAPLFPGLTPPIEHLLHLSLVTLDTVPVFIMKMKYRTAIVSASSPPRCLCLLTALEQEQVTLCILSPPTPVSPSHCTPPGCGLWSLCINAKSQGSAAACGNPFVLSYPPGAAHQRPANRHSDQIKSHDCRNRSCIWNGLLLSLRHAKQMSRIWISTDALLALIICTKCFLLILGKFTFYDRNFRPHLWL